MIRLSISRKLLIYFFLLSFIGIIIVGTYSYFKAKNALISRTFNQLTSVRIEKTNRVEEFFQSTVILLSQFSEYIFLVDPNQLADGQNENQEQTILINAFFHSEQSFESIVYFNNSNEGVLFSLDNNKLKVDSLSLENRVYENLKLQLSSNEIAVIDNYVEPDVKDVKILIAKKSEGVKANGIVALFIPIRVINDIMFDSNPLNGLGKSGEAYLVGEDHLMRSTSRFHENSILNTKVETDGVLRAFTGQTGLDIIEDYRNISVLSSYSTLSLPYLKWAILAEIDLSEAMISVNLIRNSIIYLIIMISLLTLGVVSLLSNTITLPIKILKKETRKISEGKYGETIDFESNDELGDLVLAFNEMTTKLDEQSKKLDQERKLRFTSLINGQELERQRLSRELHDSLGQSVLAIKMKLENAMNADSKESKEILSEAQKLFSSTAQEIRNISNNLMPAVLKEFGLETAIRNLRRDLIETTNIEIHFSSQLPEKRLDTKIETYLFRICQEAFNNILKYSKANSVKVDLKIIDQLIILEIDDNGIGFELNEVNLIKGNGISNMKGRTELLNGVFTIQTREKNGTKIQAKIPVKYKNY